MTSLGARVAPARLGLSQEEEGDDDIGNEGSAIELQGETFLGVAERLEPKGTCVGVSSLCPFGGE